MTKAPALPEGHVVARAANATGNREMEMKGGLRSGPLAVAVNCRGEGELAVTVEPVGLSFSLRCVAGRTSSAYNQLDLKRSRARGTVSVSAPSTVRWAIAVGR